MLEIPWRTGVNMREFAYYHTKVRPLPPETLQRDQLKKLKEMGVKLVRFWGSAADCTTEECITQVRKALDLLDEFEMQAIVCLDDSLGSGFSVPGTGGLHTADGHYDKSYWVTEGYKQHYLPHVEAMVGALGNHPAVMIWELGNEYSLHPSNPLPSQADIDAFFNFVKAASEAIKKLSPRKLVGTGFLNSRQISYALPDDGIKGFAARLYSLPSVDVIGVHYYKQDDEKKFGLIDTAIAISDAVGKPFYVGELGALRDDGDRPGYYRQEIQEMKNNKAFAVLPWQFDVHNMDANIGDDKAMSRQYQNKNNADFDKLCEVVQSFSAAVDRFVMPEIEGAGVRQPMPETRVMAEAADAGEAHKFFTVTFEMGLNIREEPSTDAAILGGLQKGDTIEVEPDSKRTDADNAFVWWHHVQGWSAERSVDGATIFMQETDPAVVEAILSGRKLEPGASMPIIERGRRREHTIRKFVVEPGETVDVNGLPRRDRLFKRLPVDLESIDWIQPFGNTKFAFGLSLAADQGTRDSYNFSQGLHGGLDLGYSQSPGQEHARVVVRAGVRGIVAPPQTSYNPNRVRVNVNPTYQIIYGHLSAEVQHPDYVPLNIGDEVNEDTIIGEIAPVSELQANGIRFTPHLHLEIRYPKAMYNLILNPYMFLPDELFEACIAKSSEGYQPWVKWQGDFDQPVIRLMGGVIGPRVEVVG